MYKIQISCHIIIFALLLMFFQCKSASPLSVASYNGNLHKARMLVEQGKNVDHYDGWGLTPLMWACHYRNYDVVDLLLQNGANPNLKSRLSYGSMAIGSTPLMFAAYQGHSMIVKLLLKNNASKSIKDASGRSAEKYALKGGNHNIIVVIRE